MNLISNVKRAKSQQKNKDNIKKQKPLNNIESIEQKTHAEKKPTPESHVTIATYLYRKNSQVINAKKNRKK